MGSFSICCYIIYANFSWVLPVMSSHSGDVNMKRPSMMFLSITICFRCQKGGQPTSLDSTVSHLSSLRKMHKNQEKTHKMYDKESLGALHLLFFSRREADLCVDSNSREKVDRGGNCLKKIYA